MVDSLQATSRDITRQLVSGQSPLKPLIPHTYDKEDYMITFIAGTMLGGSLGVVLMCLLQVSKHGSEVDSA